MNRHKSHLLVLPEDDADRQLANGFLKGLVPHQINSDRLLYIWRTCQNLFGRVLGINELVVQLLSPPRSGGWIKVPESFEKNYVSRRE